MNRAGHQVGTSSLELLVSIGLFALVVGLGVQHLAQRGSETLCRQANSIEMVGSTSGRLRSCSETPAAQRTNHELAGSFEAAVSTRNGGTSSNKAEQEIQADPIASAKSQEQRDFTKVLSLVDSSPNHSDIVQQLLTQSFSGRVPTQDGALQQEQVVFVEHAPSLGDAFGHSQPIVNGTARASMEAAAVRIVGRAPAGSFRGSGTLVEYAPSQFGVLTNRHVVHNDRPSDNPDSYHLFIGESEVPVWTGHEWVDVSGTGPDIAIIPLDKSTLTAHQIASAVELGELRGGPRYPSITVTAGYPGATGEEFTTVAGYNWGRDRNQSWSTRGEQPFREFVPDGKLGGLSGSGVYMPNSDGTFSLAGVHWGGNGGNEAGLSVTGREAYGAASSLLGEDYDSDGIPNGVDAYPTVAGEAASE